MNTRVFLFSLLSIFLLTINNNAAAEGESLELSAALKVEIFITSWCPYCQALEKLLKEENIPYTRYDIEKNPKGKKLYSQLGLRGVPITRVNRRELISGFQPELILSAIRRAGRST